MDRGVIDTDVHFENGCVACHGGNETAVDQPTAHKGMDPRPSDDPGRCGECHPDIAETYRDALHYTTQGLREGVVGRFSEAERKTFDKNVFEKSCRTCHASCGGCHVKSPDIAGIPLGLIDKHRFIRKDEAKTCAYCHGGRVYPEFTGQYGVVKDAHFRGKMMCMDCHRLEELHGDGHRYAGRRDRRTKPDCRSCHPPDRKQSQKAQKAHATHDGVLSCTACHSLSTYKNCSGCHLGKGAKATTGFFLGRNPHRPTEVTTLRRVPAARDTFASAGLEMSRYDTRPNYWDAVPHVINKLTERTNNCYMCHVVKMGFLKAADLDGEASKANRRLIYEPKPIPSSAAE